MIISWEDVRMTFGTEAWTCNFILELFYSEKDKVRVV